MQKWQWNPENLYLIKNVEDTLVTFADKPQMKIKSLKEEKHWYLIHTWSEKAFKGTVVNRALPFLHWESPQITLTVPLRNKPTTGWNSGRVFWNFCSVKIGWKKNNLNSTCLSWNKVQYLVFIKAIRNTKICKNHLVKTHQWKFYLE